MKRMVLLAAGFALVVTGAAAAASYRQGHYYAGKVRNGPGISLDINAGSFYLERVSLTDKCVGGGRSFTEQYTWISGPSGAVTGKIKRDGSMSGKYSDSRETVTLRGRISGTTATVTVRNSGTFSMQDGTRVSCSGSKTFRAKRSAHSDVG